MNYYNEWDKHAAAWLRELIKAGEIPAGEVDERSISDVAPNDIRGFTQCHFFAGIGGWAYALKLAGWPEDRPVWTGSCPCQPFSVAGKGLGTADKRHLWPEFARLIAACKPSVCFGEQVSSKDGRSWLAGVFTDLEKMGYQRAGADLCAAGIGAPHIRQRLFWVGHSESIGGEHRVGGLCNSSTRENEGSGRHENGKPLESVPASAVGGLANNNNKGLQIGQENRERTDAQPTAESCSAWHPADLITCRDGKQRRIEPGTFEMAHGLSDFLVCRCNQSLPVVDQKEKGEINATTSKANAKPTTSQNSSSAKLRAASSLRLWNMQLGTYVIIRLFASICGSTST